MNLIHNRVMTLKVRIQPPVKLKRIDIPFNSFFITNYKFLYGIFFTQKNLRTISDRLLNYFKNAH